MVPPAAPADCVSAPCGWQQEREEPTAGSRYQAGVDYHMEGRFYENIQKIHGSKSNFIGPTFASMEVDKRFHG